MAKIFEGSESILYFLNAKKIKFYFSNGNFYHWKNGFINCYLRITVDYFIFNLRHDNSQFYFFDECDSVWVGA